VKRCVYVCVHPHRADEQRVNEAGESCEMGEDEERQGSGLYVGEEPEDMGSASA
jgi:hypothetical protein